MLYAILAYHVEAEVMSWTQEEDAAVMADLGVDATAPTGAIAPLPDASTLAGVLYVLEGASLGAKLLRRRAAALGLSEAFGARHLAEGGRDRNWRILLERLEKEETIDIEAAAGASLGAFSLALASFAHLGEDAAA